MKKSEDILYAEFALEIAKSEYKRAQVMMGAFTFGLAVTIINYFLINDDIVGYYGGTVNYFIVVGWLGLFILYEYFISRFIWSNIRRRKKMSNAFRIAQSLMEVTLVSILAIYMVAIKGRTIFLDSPVNLLYYLFLILSVLHLRPVLSLLTGIFGALQYALVTWYSFHFTGMDGVAMARSTENSYYLDCVVLMLTAAAAAYVAGQLKSRVKVSLEARQARNKMALLFGQQVSQEVVNALVDNKGILARQEATVLALDIRNFTNFARHHTPDEILEYQNKVFGPIIDIIAGHDGVVNQIMGDGLMATFGTLVPNPRHAELAFLAALEIREKINELSNLGIIPPTRVGLGIHTGEVVTGNIGNETRKQYSISGSAVIIAFRVEQLNKEFGSELLITGEVSRRLMKSLSNLSYMGHKPIKGFEYEVDVYRAA